MKTDRIIISTFLAFIVAIIIMSFKPENLSLRLNSCWNNICVVAIIMVIIFSSVVYRERELFSPFLMTSVLLFALFVYAPLTCIITNDLNAVGNIDVFDGCLKASWIFISSYIAFSFGYVTKKRFVLFRKNILQQDKIYENKLLIEKTVAKKSITAVLIWCICLLITLIYDLSRGVSIIYIFSYGILGGGGTASSLNSSLAILGNFAYALIVCWLYILCYSKNRMLIVGMAIITGSIYFSRGFRFVMMIMILSPIIYWYIRKNKRPKIINTILAVVGLIILAGLIEASRGAIRAGTGGLNLSYSPIELINRVFLSDFTIFKQFYAMVLHIPRDLGYKFGQEMFWYTLIMAIPRGIWPGKPDFPYKEVLKVSLSEQAVMAGQAWPIIGAFYFEFGILGCIIFMYILGYVFARIADPLFSKKMSLTYMIGYAVFIPSIMQIICRGCIPQQIYMLLFTYLPILIIDKFKIRFKIK